MKRTQIRRTRTVAAKSLAQFMRDARAASDGGAKGCVMITGAGMSTSSGLPDYRGPQGLYHKGHKPITFSEFMSGPRLRQRYWARSMIGFRNMNDARPNSAHVAAAALLHTGVVTKIVTQNVDGLHLAATTGSSREHAYDRSEQGVDVLAREMLETLDDVGAAPPGSKLKPHDDVVELHGNINRVRCLQCGALSTRAKVQRYLEDANRALLAEHGFEVTIDPTSSVDAGSPILRSKQNNPTDQTEAEAAKRGGPLRGGYNSTTGLPEEPKAGSVAAHPPNDAGISSRSTHDNSKLRPDGDFNADSEFVAKMAVAPCPSCGDGILKPDVVFFGESVPEPTVDGVFDSVKDCSCIVCAGTSLQVFSAFRFVREAKKLGKPIAILNTGPTRGDDLADLRIDHNAEDVLPYVALEAAQWAEVPKRVW